MSKETITTLASDIRAIEAAYPALYALLARLAEEFSVSEIDPESGLATPASELVAAFEA